MKHSLKNKIVNLTLITLGGLGLIWLSLQDDFIFIYFHPISIISMIFFTIGVVRSLIQIFRLGLKTLIIETIALVVFLLTLLGLSIKDSELMKSEKILESILIDDLTSINLILRKDGSFETISNTIYGSDAITGEYNLIGDTIFFKDRAYDNDFIPNRILIDEERQRIWIKTKEGGKFDTTEYFAGYFEIRYIDLD